MLANTRVMTTLPVVDIERARRFYSDALGLGEAGRAPDGGVIFKTTDGSAIELVPHKEPTKAEHTALSFEVDDIEREVQDLESHGVKFEDYDLPELKTERHVAMMGSERAAWFKDPEGNILCIHQSLQEETTDRKAEPSSTVGSTVTSGKQ